MGEAAGLQDVDLPPRPPKRKIVVDSDDDGDLSARDGLRAKRARTFRSTLVDSDDELNEGPAERRRGKNPQINTSESVSNDSSDDEVGLEGVTAGPTDNNTDADCPQRPMSLAERLQAHRVAHPIPLSSDDGGSSSEGSDLKDEDEDDDEDDENSGGIIDGMASESDGEGEEYESER